MLAHLPTALWLAALSAIAAVAQPCLSSDFSLAMEVPTGTGSDSNVWLSLNAIDSGTANTLYLVGEKLARYAGSPVALNGSSNAASVYVEIGDKNSHCGTIELGTFGLSVGDLGERYGASEPVLATKGLDWPYWSYASGEIYPPLTAASQQLYACNTTIKGASYLTLSFGVYNSNGSSPYGCSPTQVKQVFNIPCANA